MNVQHNPVQKPEITTVNTFFTLLSIVHADMPDAQCHTTHSDAQS